MVFCHLSLPPSSSVKILMFMWIQIVSTKENSQYTRYLESCPKCKQIYPLHSHLLDLILSLSDSSFVSNVTVGNLALHHAFLKCHLDFSCHAMSKVNSIFYCRYHKIKIQRYCEYLTDTSFVLSPVSMAADLYDQYISDLGGVLDMQAQLICQRSKKTPAGWLSDSYCSAKCVRHQFEHIWHKYKSQSSRSRFHRQTAQCNTILNKDKAEYYSTIINDNSHDPKK